MCSLRSSSSSKGQLNLGFIVSTLLLVVIIISITQAVMKWPPLIKERADQNLIVSRASALNKVLLDTAGAPPDWDVSGTPVSLGIVAYNNYSNTSVIGFLGSRKLDYINSSTYFGVKSLLGMDNDTDFYLKVYNSSNVFAEVMGSFPGSSTNVVSINRDMMINNSETNIPVNVTLLVW